MDHEKECPNCGASMVERWHLLTPGLVQILIKCIRAVKNNNQNRFHWDKDMQFDRSESHNFHKLRYHGLIAHADPDNKKSGYWLLTDRAGRFLRGEIRVPKKVKTFRNHVVDHGKEMVDIKALVNQSAWFETAFEFDIRDGKLIQPVKQPTLL